MMMMVSNYVCLFGTRYTILYLFLVSTLLSNYLIYCESLILSRLAHHHISLQPYVTAQPTRLQLHKCRVHVYCGDQDQNYFSLPNNYGYQTSENVRNEIRHVSPDTFEATINPYVGITRKPSTENIFYDSNSVTPYTQMSNIVWNYQIDKDCSQVITPNNVASKTNSLTKLKQIIENKKSRIVSQILNTKQQFHESSRCTTPVEYEFDPTGNNEETGHLQEQQSTKTIKENAAKHSRRMLLLHDFREGLDMLERKFYMVTFTKLTNMTAIGPRSENSISFVQSGLFLQLLLLALSIERDLDTRFKIDNCIGIRNISNAERVQLIEDVVALLPNSTHGLIFRWSSHLMLGPKCDVSEEFKSAAAALALHLDQFNGTESPEMLTTKLNRMVEEDSKGAIHNTFEPEDLTGNIRAIFLTTLYLRSRWRSAPTVLNGSRIFRDFHEEPDRTIRMIRVNDIMRYANLTDCDAEALEVFYGKPGLSLLILVPQGSSLRRLAAYVAETGLNRIMGNMRTLRVAADLPLYTLRMSLLLPNKLDGLGLSDLLHESNNTDSGLKMSHGMQRLMFWAEAGRTAFKDDGMEWDDPPDMKIIVDRPYLFFVRWENMTLMNGNFVL